MLIEPTWVGLSSSEIVTIVKAGRKPRYFYKFVPVGNAVRKLEIWKQQDCEIFYLSSRTLPNEVDDIRNVLVKYRFPAGTFLYRKYGEAYKDIAERIIPDILIEDDYASDGGVADMTYPHLNPEAKKKIISIIIPEFSGIDQLPDNIIDLANYSK